MREGMDGLADEPPPTDGDEHSRVPLEGVGRAVPRVVLGPVAHLVEFLVLVDDLGRIAFRALHASSSEVGPRPVDCLSACGTGWPQAGVVVRSGLHGERLKLAGLRAGPLGRLPRTTLRWLPLKTLSGVIPRATARSRSPFYHGVGGDDGSPRNNRALHNAAP